jgi:hypothetical protein
MTEVISQFPHLTLERPSYETDFRDGMRKLGVKSRTIFLGLLEACVGENSPYIGKVVLGVPPFAVHLYEPEFPTNVVAWFAPRRDYVLVRLYRGTYVGDVLNLVTNPNMRGTPHPMNLRISELSEIPTALAYIRTAAYLRNPR